MMILSMIFLLFIFGEIYKNEMKYLREMFYYPGLAMFKFEKTVFRRLWSLALTKNHFIEILLI